MQLLNMPVYTHKLSVSYISSITVALFTSNFEIKGFIKLVIVYVSLLQWLLTT